MHGSQMQSLPEEIPLDFTLSKKRYWRQRSNKQKFKYRRNRVADRDR